MSALLTLRLEFDGVRAGDLVAETGEVLVRALEFEALAEVRDRLLDLLQVPDQLFRVDVEDVTAGAFQCRAFLKLTDAGRDLTAALQAGDVDLLVVKKALGQLGLSRVSQPGVEPETAAGATRSPLRGGDA